MSSLKSLQQSYLYQVPYQLAPLRQFFLKKAALYNWNVFELLFGLPYCEPLLNHEGYLSQNLKAKQFELADKIRSSLSDLDIQLEDKPDGTIWKFKS